MIVWRLPKPGMVRDRLEARLAPPSVPGEAVAAVLAAARLQPAKSTRNLPNGWRNRIVLVTSGDRRLVIRGYPQRWTPEAIELEHSILNELGRRRFPAPRLVDLGAGPAWREVGGVRYAALGFEPGTALTGYYLSRSTICRLQRLAGETLADFHRALAGFVPAGRHHLGIDPGSGEPRRDLSWHLAVLDELQRRGAVPGLEGTSEELGVVRRRLTELEARVVGAGLPRAIVHGDYGLHNLLFRAGEVVVHDFELSRPDIRLLDTVSALSRLRPEFRAPFVEGLTRAGGMDEGERALLAEVWEWHRLRGAIQSGEAFLRLGGEHRRAAMSKRLAEAGRIRSGQGMLLP